MVFETSHAERVRNAHGSSESPLNVYSSPGTLPAKQETRTPLDARLAVLLANTSSRLVNCLRLSYT